GTAKAISVVAPETDAKQDGMAMRVPLPNRSSVYITATGEKSTTAAEWNAAMSRAADGPLRGILEYCTEQLVSRDFNGNPHSSILDASLTKVMDGTLVKVFAWYDNEWGFSNRMRDVASLIGSSLR